MNSYPKYQRPNGIPGDNNRFILYHAAGVVTFNNDRTKILVVYPTNGFGGSKFTLPKGRIDPTDQTILDTAKREWYEEVGLPSTLLNFIFDYPIVSIKSATTFAEYFVAQLRVHDDIIKYADPPISEELGFPETEIVTWVLIQDFKSLSRRNKIIVDEMKRLGINCGEERSEQTF